MDKGPIMLGPIQTENKNKVPAPKILQTTFERKGNKWIETDRDGRIQGHNEIILVSTIDCGLSMPAAYLFSSFL